MGKKIILFLAFLFLSPVVVAAADPQKPPAFDEERANDGTGGPSVSGLPIPRFVSLSSDKVFVRTGPGLRYPIRWTYQRKDMPVEIVQEFDTWRKIRDMDGDNGWVHQSMLSGTRTGVITGEQEVAIRKKANPDGPIVAMMEPNVVAYLKSCVGEWCKVAAEGYSGWAQRKFLWGIYGDEDFD